MGRGRRFGASDSGRHRNFLNSEEEEISVEKLAHLARQQRTELEATAPNTAAWLIQYKPFAVNEYVEREERISPNLGLNKTVMFSTMLGTHWMIQRPSKTHFNSELSDVNRNPESYSSWIYTRET
jgi:hypothetical protein